MSKRALLASTVLVAFVGVAVAAQPLMVKPGVYDPDNTNTVSAKWVAKEGLPDVGKSDHALVLVKATDTPTNSAAGATIEGVEGLPADGIYGFDSRLDSYCGAGAPRFNLLATDGFHFIGGCANGTATPAGNDAKGRPWKHVTFDSQNPAQAFPPVAPGATIISLTIIVDEDTRPAASGAAIIDNILVDGTLIGQPGGAK